MSLLGSRTQATEGPKHKVLPFTGNVLVFRPWFCMEEGCSNLWLWTAMFNSPLTTSLSTQASWQLNICISHLSALTLLKLLCCSTPALWSLRFLPLDAIQNTGQVQSRAEDVQLLPSRVWHWGFEEERSWPLPSPSASSSFHTSWVHQMPFSSESWGSPLLDPTFPYANKALGWVRFGC